jgi:hypothetical protein
VKLQPLLRYVGCIEPPASRLIGGNDCWNARGTFRKRNDFLAQGELWLITIADRLVSWLLPAASLPPKLQASARERSG